MDAFPDQTAPDQRTLVFVGTGPTSHSLTRVVESPHAGRSLFASSQVGIRHRWRQTAGRLRKNVGQVGNFRLDFHGVLVKLSFVFILTINSIATILNILAGLVQSEDGQKTFSRKSCAALHRVVHDP